MASVITGKVGYKGNNIGREVAIINDLLNRVPDSNFRMGGSRIRLGTGYTADTDKMIYWFQLKHFPQNMCDACVWPNGGTLAKLLALAGSAPAPGPVPVPAPAPAPGAPAKVLVRVTKDTDGFGLVPGYHPDDSIPNQGVYRVGLYKMHLSRASVSGSVWQPEGAVTTYKVIRFGVSIQSKTDKSKTGPARIVGLADKQGYPLNWAGHYMQGSWQLYGNFLIHQGASLPETDPWGANGCIEVTGSGAWKDFKKRALELSFGAAPPAGAEAKIAQAQSFRCEIEAAGYPALIKVR